MRFGEKLIEAGVNNGSQLDTALQEQAVTKRLLGETLLELGYVDERRLLRTIAQTFGTKYIVSEKLSRLPIAGSVLELIPRQLAEEHGLLPIFYEAEERSLWMVGSEPQNQQGILEARIVSGAENVQVFVAGRRAVEKLIEIHYRSGSPEGDEIPEEEIFAIEVELVPSDEDPRPATPPGDGPSDPEPAGLTRVLVDLLEHRTPGRTGHSARVAVRAGILAKRLGAPETEAAHIVLAATLHDLGKQGHEHFTVMHPGDGSKCFEVLRGILQGVRLPSRVEAILEHLYSLSSGPERRVAEPAGPDLLGAAIIAAAEVLDDLTTNPENPYGRTFPAGQAVVLMREQAGVAFEPRVLEVLGQLIEEEFAGTRPTGTQPVIVIADRDGSFNSTLKAALERSGYAVRFAANSMEAMAWLANEDVAAVVVNTTLEPLGGYALLDQIVSAFRRVPAIMVAEDPQPEHITMAFKTGAADFINKRQGVDGALMKILRLLEKPRASGFQAYRARTAWAC